VRAGKEGATMALLTALEERHKASGDIIGKKVRGLKQNQPQRPGLVCSPALATRAAGSKSIDGLRSAHPSLYAWIRF